MQHWLHAPAVRSVPAGQTYPTSQGVPFETWFKQVEGRGLGCKRKRLKIWTRFSLLLAFLLGFVLVLSVCNVYKTKILKSGLLTRRLAGDYDENFPMPPSPELAFLCSASQDWVSLPSSPGEPRTSPLLVEAVLQNIEQPLETSPPGALAEKKDAEERLSPGAGHGQQGASTSPPGGSGDENAGQEPGQSWRLTRTPQLSPHPVPSGTLSSGAQHSLAVEAGQASAGSTPVRGEEPSTSSAAPAALAGQVAASTKSCLTHRYIRVPPLQEGATPKAWSPRVVLSPLQWAAGSNAPMLEIRRLLLLPSLSTNDVNRLVDAAEELANFTYHRMNRRKMHISPSKVVRERGTRFLVFNALYSVVQVVGKGLPFWWREVAEATLAGCDFQFEVPFGTRSKKSHRLALDLGAALALYRSGNAPSPEEVIRLKCELFFSDESPEFFRRSLWNPWRDDNKAALDERL